MEVIVYMSFISNWAQGIIVSVMVATIIEMLLPQNGNGKYVKVVIGIFVLFTIVSPVVSKFKSKDKIASSNLDLYLNKMENDAIQTSNISFSTEQAIKMMYEENLKIDIKSKISQKGYTVGDINLEILDNDEYTLNKIEAKITDKQQSQNVSGRNVQTTTTIVENVENIKVSLGGSAKDKKNNKQEPSILSESEKRKLKEYLSNVYEVNENNILIN